jgi:hypothetical protein
MELCLYIVEELVSELYPINQKCGTPVVLP